VLFADVTGSTAIGEQLDVERLRSLLTAYFSAMAAIIEAWGGTVEKFIGDAVVAYFGVPLVREDDADRALRAAMEMLERLKTLNESLRAQHGIVLAIRIGINTGEVITPLGGTADQVIGGDVVNVASRLQESALPGTVLVGQRTFQAVRDAFRFEAPVDLVLKGKTGSVRAHRVVEALARAPQRVLRLQSQMVGRDRELQTLVSLLDEALEARRPLLSIVYGPAGIGKSRLVHEFLQAASSLRPAARVLQGRCAAVGHGITYWALSEILRQACAVTIGDPVPVVQEKLRECVRLALSSLHLAEDEVQQTMFALATSAGIPLPNNPLDAESPLAISHVLERAWPRFASGYAAPAGAIFVVEDLHWASAPMLQMLDRFLTRVSGPLLIVATARPEFAQTHPAFAAGRDGVTALSIRPLSESQSLRLVDGLLANSRLPGAVRDSILATGEGNPFFLEEILRRLIDEGTLVHQDDAWQATLGARVTALPDSVHALLAARIDALPQLEKRVLQEAAVVGRVFWEEPVSQALGDGSVSQALLNLEGKGFVLSGPSSTLAGQIEFTFKHALVRDVAYASLSKARRARAHAEVATWMEAFAGARVEEVVELIARHYQAAVVGEDASFAWAEDRDAYEAVRARAFKALTDAGAGARKRFSISMALELHGQALALATSPRERVEALEALGDDHEAIFHGDEAVGSWEAALRILRAEPGTADHRTRLCLKAAQMAVMRWGGFRVPADPAVGDRFVDEGLETGGDPAVRTQLLALRARCGGRWAWSGRADPVPVGERRDAAEEARRLADQSKAPALQGLAIHSLNTVNFIEGSYSKIIPLALEQVDFMDRAQSNRDKALAHLLAGVALANIEGRFEDGLAQGRTSQEFAKALAPHDQMHATCLLMECLYHLGRWDEVEPLLAQHLDLFQGKETEMSCPFVRGGPLVGAIVLCQQGQRERAQEVASRVTPEVEHPGMAEALHARLAIALGDPTTGRGLAERLVGLGRRSGPEEIPPETLVMVEALEALQDWEALERFLPTARRMAGVLVALTPTCDRAEGLAKAAVDAPRALQLLERAHASFERLGMLFEAARTKEELARIVPVRARNLLAQALATYEKLGAAPHVSRVRVALGMLSPTQA
jgi:class 3 adenylate cyclase